MTLEAGTRLGAYEILGPLGAGGMGEVYKARDTRLERLVAIKILPAHMAVQSDARERFEREARAVAALNHPHVCTLFDVGTQDGIHFLVMEHLEGETLADRLAKGPLPLDQALRYAIEIADALDKAHRQGVVHRDLKPGNIMLTKAGSKLLDFGLARLKQAGPAAQFSSASNAPTAMAALTTQGAIIGTLQYMAPEQLEGKEADARTDLFAFGSLLYEMVSGRKAFDGKSQVSLMGAILERDPVPVRTLQPGMPEALDRVIRRCLAKDPDSRWQTAGDLGAELQWVLESPAPVQALQPAAAPPRTPKLWIAAAALFFVIAATLGALLLRPAPEKPADVVRFTVPLPEGMAMDSGVGTTSAFGGSAISPDGRRIVFTAREGTGSVLLWIRALDGLTSQSISGTDGAGLPFWSPDSRSVAFFAQGKLKKIDVAGGPPQTLCDAPNGRGGSWGPDGTILFSPEAMAPIHRVSTAGGASVPATTLSPQSPTHRFPAFLSDGVHFLYGAQNGTDVETFLASLKSSDVQSLVKADSAVLFSSAGYLLFVRQGALFAQPFDEKKLQFTGDAVPVAEQVLSGAGAVAASVSANGTLTYRTGQGVLADLQLAWLDRTGRPVETFGTLGPYRGVEVSRDGRKIAVHRHEGAGGDIWTVETGSPMSRFTFDPAADSSNPIWSPDGTHLAYASLRNGKWNVYQKPANGAGAEELLLQLDVNGAPMSWSPDGKFLVYYIQSPKTNSDLWALPLEGDRKPFSIVEGPGQQFLPDISPDGKFIVYNSVESGRNEIYVNPFPKGEGHWQITTNGASGTSVRWSRDGKELFYLSADAAPKMMGVPVTVVGATLKWGAPRELFDPHYVNTVSGHAYHDFAVSADGRRFLIPQANPGVTLASLASPVNVVLNWTSLLKR